MDASTCPYCGSESTPDSIDIEFSSRVFPEAVAKEFICYTCMREVVRLGCAAMVPFLLNKGDKKN